MRNATSLSRPGIARAAEKIHTPFYLYDADAIRARYLALKAALPENWRLFYAAKANPNLAILKVYRALGAPAECASAGEMLACFKAGYAPADIVLSGPVKTERELAVLKRKPPRMIHAETEGELRALNALGVALRVALRINVDTRLASPERGRIMSGGMDKFGFSPEEARRVLRRRGDFGRLEFCGFHFYMGTNIPAASAWLTAARAFADVAAGLARGCGLTPTYLNFGGGLGIPYKGGGRVFNLAEFRKGLVRFNGYLASIPSFHNAVRHIEPGRYLMGPCGAYVMKVTGLKKMRGARFALTDGGIHHALFPFRVSREFPASLVKGKGGPVTRYVLGGPLCTTLDQSDLPLRLPKLREGDIIAIHNSGAYGYGTGMHYFLSHPLPAEAMLDGRSLLLIRESSASAHLFRYQLTRKL